MKLESTYSEILKWFQMNFPEMVDSMKSSSHHFSENKLNPYHLESDIFTHTMLVFKMGQMLSPDNNFVKWSTLLHDIGKPLSMEVIEEKERVRFIGHEGISAFMAVDVLNKTTMIEEEKLMLFKMIALHGSLFNHLTKDLNVKNDVAEIFKYNKSLLENLVHQVRADTLGRFSDAIDSYAVDDISLSLPEIFSSTIDQLDDTTPQGNVENKPTLTLLVGAPCSFKSTWVEKNKKDKIVLSRDNLVESVGKKYNKNTYSEAWYFFQENKDIEKNEVDEVLTKSTQEAVKNRKSVIVDMTNMSKKSRRKWINQFGDKYFKEAIVFVTGYEAQLECNIKREKETGKRISKSVTLGMLKSFSLPMYSEKLDNIEYIWNS